MLHVLVEGHLEERMEGELSTRMFYVAKLHSLRYCQQRDDDTDSKKTKKSERVMQVKVSGSLAKIVSEGDMTGPRALRSS